MAINFSISDVLIPNRVYVDKTLANTTSTPTIKQALEVLGVLDCVPSTVAAIGSTSYPVKSYIRVVPNDTSHRFYNKGLGVNVYFANDEQLNNSFELSTAFIKDKCFLKVLNNSGGPITKNQIVRQIGFDPSAQLATISLADATTDVNAVVFGITVEDIADGEMGSILVSGSVQIDTSSFSIGDSVFLNDTPGAISTTAGTVFTVVGKVLTVGIDGTMSMFSSLSGSGSGSGFFTDGTGTNAAIGKGATAPIASGANSFAHGDNSSATGNNTFASGQNCAVNSAINTFVQGYDCIADAGFASYDSFAQGNNCVVGPSGFSQGTNISNYGSWTTFAQGHSIYIESYGSYNTFGTFAQGYGHTITSATSVLVQGYPNSVTSNHPNNRIRDALVQGENNTIYTTKDINNIFIQGEGNSATEISQTFIQGSNCSVTSGGGGFDSCFLQGLDVSAHSGNRGSFAQGWNIYGTGYASFMQGYNLRADAGPTPSHYSCLTQGAYNYINGYTGCLTQGFRITLSGASTYTSVQGGRHTLTHLLHSSFIQGSRIETTDQTRYSFAQGMNIDISGDRVFAQGTNIAVSRDDQKTWGSNVTGAHKSRIVKWATTSSATPINIVTLDLEEDKSYGLQTLLIARNTITNTETASFKLVQATAYRDSAGTAILVSGPVALTRDDSGGGAATWSARILASGNNILLEITGDATDFVRWCADFEFVEVAG
jgi:hypothetical protein